MKIIWGDLFVFEGCFTKGGYILVAGVSWVNLGYVGLIIVTKGWGFLF